jgi:hypothetical protein
MANQPESFSNLDRLWMEEDEIRRWASNKIAESKRLTDFVALAKHLMDYIYFLRPAMNATEEKTATGLLLLRVFDSVSYSLRDTLSGRYRSSANHIRDLLEIEFLLDYTASRMEPEFPVLTQWVGTIQVHP